MLQRRFPAIRGPFKEDICYATTNRQEAVKAIAARIDLLLVVGRAQLVQFEAAGRSGRQDRLPARACWCSGPAISTGRACGHCAQSD